MSNEIDGTYEIYQEDRRRARKEHRCSACRETIRKGDFYWRVFLLWEHTPETLKRCLRCQRIHLHLRGLGASDMWPDEQLNCGEEYKEHWGVEPPPDIAALAFQTPDDMQKGTR